MGLIVSPTTHRALMRIKWDYLMENAKSCTRSAVRNIWTWEVSSTCSLLHKGSWSWTCFEWGSQQLENSEPFTCLVLALFSPACWPADGCLPCRVAGLERSVGSRCRQRKQAWTPTLIAGSDWIHISRLQGSISGQTHCGDPKLAPCGVSCLIA